MPLAWNKNIVSGETIKSQDVEEIQNNQDIVYDRVCYAHYQTRNSSLYTSNNGTHYPGYDDNLYTNDDYGYDGTYRYDENTGYCNNVYSSDDQTYNSGYDGTNQGTHRDTVQTSDNYAHVINASCGANYISHDGNDYSGHQSTYDGNDNGTHKGSNDGTYKGNDYSNNNSSILVFCSGDVGQ